MRVARGSRAAQNGLQKDDVVLAASSGEFSDLAGFRASFAQSPQRLVLRVLRGNARGDLADAVTSPPNGRKENAMSPDNNGRAHSKT